MKGSTVHLHYSRQGVPISLEQWVRELERDRRVAWTGLGRLGDVSTVYQGLNHAFGGGPPLIFETMIFGGPMAGYQERYPTEAEAMEGHNFAVLALLYHQPEKHPPLIHNGRKPRK